MIKISLREKKQEQKKTLGWVKHVTQQNLKFRVL